MLRLIGILVAWGTMALGGKSEAWSAPLGLQRLEIGDAAPDFSLPGVDGKTYSLKDFSSSPILAVIFHCNHCPTAQAYEERMIQLEADYRDRGVALVLISPNDPLAVRLDELGYTDVSDSLADMKLRAEQRGFRFPYLYDGETQSASLQYGVSATPQAFVFDADRKLRYVGRIDNADVGEVTRHELRDALDALLAGRSVPVEKTRAFGCSTKWSDKRYQVGESLEKWNAEPVELKRLSEEELNRLVRNETDKLLLVNVWATWCGPCVSELPELVDLNRRFRKRKFELITISMDDLNRESDALKTLQDNHVSCTNYIGAISDRDRLADLLDPEWTGAFPYTVLIGPGGKVIQRVEGEIDPLRTRTAIVEILGRTYADAPRKRD